MVKSGGGFSTPVGISYQIAVTPDEKSGYTEGTIWTEFTEVSWKPGTPVRASIIAGLQQ